jgi:hypothetical protein
MSASLAEPQTQFDFQYSPSQGASQTAHDLAIKRVEAFEKVSLAESPQGQAIRELTDTFLDCLYEGWDGDDARPVREHTFYRAKEFLTHLSARFPSPTASAIPDGSLTLEWIASASRRFMVSIDEDDVIAFAGLFGSERVRGTSTFVGDIPLEVPYYLKRLFLH